MAGGNSLVKKLLQRSHFNVVHHGLQDHVGNVHISASDVCVIEGHALFNIRLIGRTIRIPVAFLFWAVFQEADQLDIFYAADKQQKVHRTKWGWIVFHADHHATKSAAKPTPMAKAVK